MTTLDLDRYRTVLLEERTRVRAAIDYLHEENPGSLGEETGEHASPSAENHMGDTATATFDREVDYTLEDNSEHVLAEIEAALKRIDAGTFGRCQRCGEAIDEGRLEALPWATKCIGCRRLEERA